jgi:hypothetical protein
MLDIAGQAPAVSGLRIENFSGDVETQPAGYQDSGLFMGVGMHGDFGTPGYFELAHQSFFAVNEGGQFNAFDKLSGLGGTFFAKHVFSPFELK